MVSMSNSSVVKFPILEIFIINGSHSLPEKTNRLPEKTNRLPKMVAPKNNYTEHIFECQLKIENCKLVFVGMIDESKT